MGFMVAIAIPTTARFVGRLQFTVLTNRKTLDTVKVIVFDFDGTLCDDFKELIEIINSMSEEYGYQKTPTEKFQV